MSSNLIESTSKLVEILTPLNTDERTRVVQAALTLVGDLPLTRTVMSDGISPANSNPTDFNYELEGVSNPAKAWMNKHGLSLETMQHYFHIDQGKATPISLPGNTKEKKEQTLNTYLITGLAALLTTGEASFSDNDARSLCTHFGCYDQKNHSKYLRGLGNRVTGSKASGWKLTAPGLSAIAELIKSN